MIDNEKKRFVKERPHIRKTGSFYGEQSNESVPLQPSEQDHHNAPVSKMLALFGRGRKNNGESTKKNEN